MTQYRVRGTVGEISHKGRYLMDYSPKYQTPYDVSEKAAHHIAALKKGRGKDMADCREDRNQK